MFKMQVQDDRNDPRSWHDVRDAKGEVMVFDKEADARARLRSLYPVEVEMEKYTGPKITRVIAILTDGDESDWPPRA